MKKNGLLSFLLGDHLGSTSLTTDANGTLASEMKYKACPQGASQGRVRYSSGTTQTNYTLRQAQGTAYTGQYSYVNDFGLRYYGARWYDSSLGRFKSADTIVPRESQGYDRYAYANNNPVRYTDPTGHCPWCFAVGVGAIGVGALAYVAIADYVILRTMTAQPGGENASNIWELTKLGVDQADHANITTFDISEDNRLLFWGDENGTIHL